MNSATNLSERKPRTVPRRPGLSLALLLILAFTFGSEMTPVGAEETSLYVPEVDTGRKNDVLFPIEVDGSWGFIDNTGRVMVAPSFGDPGGFTDDDGLKVFSGPVYPVLVDGAPTFIDRTGRVLLTPGRYPTLSSSTPGVATHDDHRGMIDSDGRLVIRPIYDAIGPDFGGPIPVKQGELWGYVTREGSTVVPPSFDRAGPFYEGRAVVWSGKTPGVINDDGEIVFELDADGTGYYRNGYLAVRSSSNGLWGVVDADGAIVVPTEYDAIGYYQSGRARVVQNELTGYVDERGREAIAPQFVDGDTFSEGLAAVSNGSKWAYIDTQGRLVTDFVFDFAGKLIEGMARVKRDGFVGYLNHTGEVAIDPAYGWGSVFWNGGALVYRDGKMAVIGSDGRLRTPFKYDSARRFQFVWFMHANLRFDLQRYFPFGLAFVSWSDDRYDYSGYVNAEGEEIWVNRTAKPVKTTVTITTRTVAGTMYPLHASLSEIEIELNGRTHTITPYDFARNSLPDFATQVARNKMELALEGQWYLLAQLEKDGLIDVDVAGRDGDTITSKSDSGYAAVVTVSWREAIGR